MQVPIMLTTQLSGSHCWNGWIPAKWLDEFRCHLILGLIWA